MTIEAKFQITQGEFFLDVDLNLPAQGVSSLFGPSGCGKTTLLRAIAGLDYYPDAYLKVGSTVWQEPGRFMPPHKRPLGYVFQESSLFIHLSVRRNLEYGLKRVPEAERRVSLDRAIELLEIRTLLERKPDTLSGGERQRVAIARALAVSPRLLLMDEPLAALDVNRKQEILPYIESLHRELDIPVIHVSHYPDEVARITDHLVLLESGRVIASGDVHEIFTRLDLSPALASDAAAIIEAEVAGHDEAYHLTHLEFSGGRVTVPREDLREGTQVRLKLAARDVSLTLERQTDTSILNILPARVDQIARENSAQVTVRLLAGDSPLLARITRKSAADLELAPGKNVYTQIKSVALLN